MGFEHLKHDFPEMPEEIRTMIRTEVEKQLKSEPARHRSKRTVRRTLAASLAAVMLCGATVFAGVSIYRMQLQKTGEHGVRIDIAENPEAAGNTDEAPAVIPNVRLKVGYLPQGMVQTELGKYSFEDNLYQGGVSMTFFRMDTGDDQFEIQHGDVLTSEEFTTGEYQGVYLEYPNLYENDITFNQRLYVAYTDVHYVMEMYAASDVSKDEALKIAENVKLIPTEDATGEDIVVAQNWSDSQKAPDPLLEEGGVETVTSVAAEKMANTHKPGDSFPLDDQGLAVKVADVQISDDISLLDPSLADQDLKEETDAAGKLRPATIQYVKEGNADALSEEVSSRKVPQKLIYATVEYTNTGSEELTDVLFFGSLARIREAGGQVQIVPEETPSGNEEWDRAINHGLSYIQEMIYYDVHGGERNNNYIASIKPGETVTVHMAFLATEEELPTLYLNLNPSGGSYEFSDSSLEIGYVDIRQ